MCKEEYAKAINKAVFPGTQGGPLMHVIAAKAVCFGEALKPEFKEYQQRFETLKQSRLILNKNDGSPAMPVYQQTMMTRLPAMKRR